MTVVDHEPAARGAALPASLRAGWRALLAAPDRILVPTLVLSVSGFVVHLLLQYLLGIGLAGSRPCPRSYLGAVLTAQCGPTDQRAQTTLVVAIFFVYVIGHLVVAGIYRAALDLTDGRPVGNPFQVGPTLLVLGTAALSGLVLTISTAFLLVPALVVGFLVRYALLFVLDQGLGPGAALLASARFVVADLRGELGFVVAALGVLLGGVLAFGVGLYAAVPVVLIAQTQRYRARVPASYGLRS